MKSKRFSAIFTGVVSGLILVANIAPVTAGPGTKFGVRAGYYSDTEEIFLGGELLSRISRSVFFNPNVEFVTIDNGTFMTFNGDFHYDFPTAGSPLIWAGAGLGMLYFNPEGPGDNQTDVGLNLLFGVGLSRGPVIPYFQVKAILEDNNEVVLGFGIRF